MGKEGYVKVHRPTKQALPDNEIEESAVVGGEFTLILTALGNLNGCGSNKEVQLGLRDAVIDTTVPTMVDNFIMGDVVSVLAGQKFALVRTSAGLLGMGDNKFGKSVNNVPPFTPPQIA